MLLTPFKTTDHCYLYSGWSNRIVGISANLFSFFSLPGNEEKKHAEAVRLGLIPREDPSVVLFGPELAQEAFAALKNNGPEMLVLSISEACNFRCDYCYYSGLYSDSRRHSHKNMPPETAFTALEWYFGFARSEYKIGFYGGEPLLQFRLIREVVSHAEKLLPDGSQLVFGLTTNGSLLDREVCDFIAAKGFQTFVSLDGPEKIHDRHRKDSTGKPTFRTVWNKLNSFRERHPGYFRSHVNFSMTALPPDPLPDIRIFLHDNPDIFGGKVPRVSALKTAGGAPGMLNLAEQLPAIDYTGIWDLFVASAVHGQMPDSLGRSVCEASIARVHKRQMTEMGSFSTTGGQCTPGKRCYVDAEGVLHMCERINGYFPIGSVKGGYDFDGIAACLEQYAALIGSRCSTCWAVRLCRKCIPQLTEGRRLTERMLNAVCVRQKRELAVVLRNYCRAREKNNNCFDWIS